MLVPSSTHRVSSGRSLWEKGGRPLRGGTCFRAFDGCTTGRPPAGPPTSVPTAASTVAVAAMASAMGAWARQCSSDLAGDCREAQLLLQQKALAMLPAHKSSSTHSDLAAIVRPRPAVTESFCLFVIQCAYCNTRIVCRKLQTHLVCRCACCHPYCYWLGASQSLQLYGQHQASGECTFWPRFCTSALTGKDASTLSLLKSSKSY